MAEKSSPHEKTRVEAALLPPPGTGVAPKRSKAGTTSPNRLAHLLLFTPDVDAAVTFYGCVLGLRLSDRSGSNIAFMHGIHGSNHHMVAFVKKRRTRPAPHQLDVGTIHEVGLGAAQMADKGSRAAGVSDATPSARTTFTVSAIHGAATPSIPATSTSSRPTSIGKASIMTAKTRFTFGGRHRPRTSPRTTNRSKPGLPSHQPATDLSKQENTKIGSAPP